MNVHLIRPAWGQGKYFHLFDGSPPLGLAYVAAALLRAGHRVTVTDAVLEGWHNVMPYGPMVARGLHNQDVVRRVPSGTEAIGITVTATSDWPLVTDLCSRLKAAYPDVPILLGGEHPTAVPKFCLLTAPADVVVLGEGEETVVDLVAALSSPRRPLREVGGIAFLEGDVYVETAPRPRIRDLETIARPAWHLFDVEAYQRHRFVGGALWRGRRSLPMLASRGCPYRCTFCTAPDMWTPLWVPRSPSAIVDEMVFLRDTYAVTDFSLHDLTTVIRRAWVLDLCREIVDRGLDVTWQLHSGTRLEEVDDELLAHMKRAGLTYLVLAPESGSEGTRRRVDKRMKTEDIYRAVGAAVDSGLPLKVQVMLGLPGESLGDAWSNLRFVRWLARRGVDCVGTALFAPYPGTALFDELLERGDIELGDDLLFFPVANNDFRKPILRSQKLHPYVVKAYQLGTLATFVAAKLLYQPGRSARAMWNAAASDREEVFFEKLLKAMATAAVRLIVPSCNGEPITWNPIAYDRFRPEDLVRRRRMAARAPQRSTIQTRMGTTSAL